MLIAHIADAHMASGKTGKLDAELGLDQTLCDRYRAFRWCVADAAEQGADLILVAGDIFDSPTPTPTEWDLACEALTKRGPNRPVLVLAGNHESPKASHETNPLRMVRGRVSADVTEPGIHTYGDLQIVCCPWPNEKQLLAARLDLGALSVEAAIREAMMDVLRGLAADRKPAVPSVLLGHFSVDLAEAGSESRLMALGASWSLNAYDVAGLGFDLVLLGHIHKPQQVGGLPIWYAGSPCEMDFGERNDRSGYYLHDLESGAAEFRPNPHNRRHLKFVLGRGDFPPATADAKGAHVWVVIPPGEDADETGIEEWFQSAGAHNVRIQREARPVERRERGVSEGLTAEEYLRIFVERDYPEEDPEAVVAEARRIEEATA